MSGVTSHRFVRGQFGDLCRKCGNIRNHFLHARKPPADPLIRAAIKAYRGSNQHRFDMLLAEQMKWSRKRTIATNKVAEVRRKIDAFLAELVKEKS